MTSTSDQFLEGFFVSEKSSHYLLGINFSAASAKKTFSHDGSTNLDEINAFDRAEISGANLGQINMMKVSSFCGPKGLIWGYDACHAKRLPNKWGITSRDVGYEGELSILDIDPVADAFKRLTGSVSSPRFPFLPGSHVPCAMKSVIQPGVAVLYSALACGIPENRQKSACLLMEDFGHIPLFMTYQAEYIREIVINIIKSVLSIGINQQVVYKEILVGLISIRVEADEIGCAMVAAPYFTLAKKAVLPASSLNLIKINEWEEKSTPFFLYNQP